jgi:hypothetical protein
LIARLNHGQAALRASFGLGSTVDDIDRLIEALTSYLRSGPSQHYTRHDRWFTPDGDGRLAPFPEVDLVDPRRSPPSQRLP